MALFVRSLTLLLLTTGAAAGLTLQVFDNTALAGPAVVTKTLSAAAFSLPASSYGGAFSASLHGTIELHGAGSWWNFSCDFGNTTVGFVWIDGHLVCQDGKAYAQPSPGSTDNREDDRC